VRHVGDSAIGLLTDPSLTDTERESRVREVLQDAFAVEAVGRFVLGHYWRTATPAQQDAYMAIFREYVVNSIAARFGDYSGEKMQVVDMRDDHGKGTIVNTLIDSPAHGLVQVQWRVRDIDGEQKIIDIIVEGVSLLLTQRSEFAAVVSNHGGNLDALIDDLKAKVEQLKAKRPAP
jgi:phospholipid transport system substrate-binding protein